METASENATGSSIGQSIREWRVGEQLSLSDFAEKIGMAKGKVSEMERDLFRPGVRVALAIEALSGGRIDAALLNDDVKAARHGMGVSPPAAGLSAGKVARDSRSASSSAAIGQQKPLPACPSGSAAVFD